MAQHPPTPEPSSRLFLALWPDPTCRQQIAAHAAQWTWPAGCARYLPADWHITLHFLGVVANSRLPTLVAALAQPVETFELLLDQPTLWPHGIAVLCAGDTPQPLAALVGRLGQALRDLGLPVETRPYRPHVTLARHAQAAMLPMAAPPVRWPASAYALVRSTDEREPRYRVIQTYE
jgi:2'-5' RNA ligase